MRRSDPDSTTTPIAGRYVLLDQVGTGGMGSVWRAYDERSGDCVAAKVLGAHDSATLLRFVREQSLRIRHPHVVTPTGWAADDHRVVLGMDLVRGGSAADLLRDVGPLPASYVVLLLDQLLQALAAVHAAGVVHRDVKPANLLLEPSEGPPFLRLGDFGVAVPVADVRLTRGPAAVGTDGYMAPEQLAGAAPDPRQDLYAAGVVATHLLTGRPPHPRRTPMVPEGPLRPLVEALIDPDPQLRPPTAAAALERLRRLSVPADGRWPVVPDRLGDPPRTPAPRWPSVVIAASAVVIAACAAACWAMLR